MIDWKNIKDLHANKKLEHVIGKWFGVDIFYTDKHGNISSSITDKNYEFLSHFFKIQMGLSYGQEYLKQDIEKGLDRLSDVDAKCFYFDSFFPHVRMLAAKIVVDGEFQGAVFSYPYITDQLTKKK